MKQNRFDSVVKLAINPEFHTFLELGYTSFPVNVEISPVGHCNASCEFCLYKGKDLHGFIPPSVVYGLFDDLDNGIGQKAITWSGCGEPSIHPYIEDFVDHAGNLEFHQGMFTNAIAPINYNPALLDWIRVTIVPGAEIPTENIKKLRKAKTLGLCVNKSTMWANEVARTIQVAEEVKADYVHVRPVLSIDGKPDREYPSPVIGNPLVVIDEDKFDKPIVKQYSECRGYHFCPFVWHDGLVTVCAYRRDRVLGDLKKESIIDIWGNLPHTFPVDGACMQFCKNHEINEFIEKSLTIQNKEFV